MKREDIIRMAQEANLPACHTTHPKAIERFATLVASAERDRLTDFVIQAAEKAVDVAIALEREACAKVCDDHPTWTGRMCGETIKARGQA